MTADPKISALCIGGAADGLWIELEVQTPNGARAVVLGSLRYQLDLTVRTTDDSMIYRVTATLGQ